MENFLPNFFVIAVTIGCALGAVAIYYGVSQYLKFNQLTKWGELLVRQIEQQTQLDGPRKKEIVMLALRRLRDQMKSTLTDEQLEWIVEASVNIMNGAIKLIGEPLEADILDTTRDRFKRLEE